MKSAFVTEFPTAGNVSNEMKIGELPVPKLKPGEVLVRIHASSLNIDDLHMAQGTFAGGIRMLQPRKPTAKHPLVLGSDFAGIVEQVGSKVTGFDVGSRVCGLQLRPFGHEGTWSTHTVARQSTLVRIPEGCSYESAAALVMPLFVSLAIVKKAKVERGTRVLVIGASGGIGSVLIQLLRAEPNVHVTGVCSSRNVEFVRKLGADQVIDYTKGAVEDQLNTEPKFDVVADLLGGKETYNTGRALLKSRSGRFITATGPVAWLGEKKLSSSEFCKAFGTLLGHYFSNLFPGMHPYYFLVTPSPLQANALENALADGVTSKISERVNLEKNELEQAIKAVQKHKVKGKIVINIPA